MKLRGKISDINVNMLTGEPQIILKVKNKAELLKDGNDLIKKDDLLIEIKPWVNKRSLNANAYAWVLMDKIAKAQGITKEEVYIHQIRDVGIFKVVTISENAVDTLIKGWSMHGLGWVAEKLDNSEKEGFVDITLYYGSSVYNTQQMKRLIDNITEECRALGIETKTPAEIESMLSAWDKNKKKGGKADETI